MEMAFGEGLHKKEASVISRPLKIQVSPYELRIYLKHSGPIIILNEQKIQKIANSETTDLYKWQIKKPFRRRVDEMAFNVSVFRIVIRLYSPFVR